MAEHPESLHIEDYSYDLPEGLIALHPSEERDAAKLLVYKNGKIDEDVYRNIGAHIPAGSLMVFNQTKVVHARLVFRKPSGSEIEVFCLSPYGTTADIHTAMQQKGSVNWECLVGGAAKWKKGLVLEMGTEHSDLKLTAQMEERTAQGFALRLEWSDFAKTFAEVLEELGSVPLPPYLKRAAEPDDELRYQTMFARNEGSVAAPTAALHFTNGVMNDLGSKEIDTAMVTLHVGAGTFRPVKSDTMRGHEMHAEWIDVDIDTIKKLEQKGARKVVAVGTTSMRTLESLFWIGCRIKAGGELDAGGIGVSQWEPYDAKCECAAQEALTALVNYMEHKGMQRLVTRTQILIAPGYDFKLVDGLVTNFHQPRSTLLLLVAAFLGESWRKVYEHALTHKYRFLSYGDGSLLWRQQ